MNIIKRIKNKLSVAILGATAAMVASASAAMDPAAAVTEITSSTTAATTVLVAGLGVVALFYSYRLIKKALNSSK